MESKTPPSISILLPVRNGMPYLPTALKSIQQQTVTDWQLVIVDDGSEDGTPQVIRALAESDSRVVSVRNAKSLGVTAALNHGLLFCEGEFIARMDADDICVPMRLERQRECLCANPALVAVGSAVLRIDDEGAPIAVGRWPEKHADIDARLLRGEGGLPHPAAMMRRRALLQVGGYRLEYPYAQDKDLWLRLAEVGQLANLPEVLLHYREHLSKVGVIRHREQQECLSAAIRDACRRRNLPAPDRGASPSPNTTKPPYVDWIRASLRAGNLPTARKYLQRLRQSQGPTWTWWWLMARLLLTTLMPSMRNSGDVSALPGWSSSH